jgi:hypothetical protein
LRQKSDTGVWLNESNGWQTFSSFIHQPGESLWLGSGYLTAKEIYPVSLLVHWGAGEKETWCLATNLPDLSITLQYYRRRMWIEEMFGDMKIHDFNLESTMLRHFEHLSRMTLAVALIYVWLISIGTRTITHGLRELVDRTDLSIFQIGFRFIEWCVVNGKSFQIIWCSYR